VEFYSESGVQKKKKLLYLETCSPEEYNADLPKKKEVLRERYHDS